MLPDFELKILLMRRKITTLILGCIIGIGQLQAETIEKIPFGDMNSWQTRVMKESRLLGGDLKTMHAINHPKTITGDIPYRRNDVSPWATSNVLASPAGIVKTSITVFPEKRGDGYCARLEVKKETCKAIGIINVVVVASGSIYLGGMDEPIKSTKNPMGKLDQGIEFTKRPKAVEFDYKVTREDQIYKADGGSKIKTQIGRDNAEVVLYLIHRWEDANGNLYAKRVGTAYEKYSDDVNSWVNNYRVNVMYGDITKEPTFKRYMGLIPNTNPYYSVNSRGEIVPVTEVGWGDKDEAVTHMLLRFSSSDLGPYKGSVGSTFWVDNIELVY